MIARMERQLAELVAGVDGGWTLWLGALAALELAVAQLREDGRERFEAHPAQELGRLRRELDDAARRASIAAGVRAVVLEQGEASATSIATLLLERAGELAAAPA